MKISLIFPRLQCQVHGMWPPLGIITLGTILREAGHEVRCHDTSFDPDLGRVTSILESWKPDMVGVSCLTDFFPNAATLVRLAKGLGAVTVMGGPHPTIDPAGVMECLPELDYAITGEAERSLPALVEAIGSDGAVAEIPGLTWRAEGEARTGQPAEPIHDLDWIPVPDRDLLDVNKEYLRSRAVNMHASRGCPFRCRFCQPTLEKLFGRAVRFQGPERVAAEIADSLKKYGIREFFFHDDTFTVSKKWMAGLAEALDRADLIEGFRYVVNSRVDTLDEEKAALLKKMGVYYVLFGIETGSQEILDSLNKGATIEQAREAFRICRKFGFRTHAYILLGSLRETHETLAATEELVQELRPNTVHVSIYTPLLGTELAEECKALGRINNQDFDELDYYLKKTKSGRGPISIPGLTYDDLLASRERILKRRKLTVFLDNLQQLGRDLIREPSLDKFIFRYQFYKRMQHYFG